EVSRGISEARGLRQQPQRRRLRLTFIEPVQRSIRGRIVADPNIDTTTALAENAIELRRQVVHPVVSREQYRNSRRARIIAPVFGLGDGDRGRDGGSRCSHLEPAFYRGNSPPQLALRPRL